MMVKQDCQLDYVQWMFSVIIQVRSYIEGMIKVDFLDDLKIQDVVIMKLLVIGELVV